MYAYVCVCVCVLTDMITGLQNYCQKRCKEREDNDPAKNKLLRFAFVFYFLHTHEY